MSNHDDWPVKRDTKQPADERQRFGFFLSIAGLILAAAPTLAWVFIKADITFGKVIHTLSNLSVAQNVVMLVAAALSLTFAVLMGVNKSNWMVALLGVGAVGFGLVYMFGLMTVI